MNTDIKSTGAINFPAVLAFSVHEMKNSLSTISELIRHFKNQAHFDAKKELRQLEFEANRVNDNLMQLLILYKIDEAQFSLDVDECLVVDILNEVMAQQSSLFSINGMELIIDCPDDLMCYCDSNLISNTISTVVNNAQRYARKQVLLTASEENGYVCINVEDDGAGYPEHFLTAEALNNAKVNLNTGSTGLGLFFVSTIAKMHVNGDKKGFIKLTNHCPLGGAKFSLFLP